MTDEESAEEYAEKQNAELQRINKECYCHTTFSKADIKQAFQDGAKWGYDKGLRELYERIEKDSFVYFGAPTINRLKEIIKDLGVQV